MSSNVYDVGDEIKLSATFSVSGVDTDPTTITLKVQDPSGNEATYTYSGGDLTKDAAGKYSYNLTIDEAGYWYYRWEGTGACVAAGESAIAIRKSEF